MKFFHYPDRSRSSASNAQIKLHVLRLIEFFQNIKEFYGLLDDGKEKSSGEYILDFHYVSSLVEKIIERMNVIVHDACVLAPEGGENLYLQLDSSAKLAKERFIEVDRESIAERESPEDKSAVLTEPEYVLLQRVLDWMDEKESGTTWSFMQLLYNVLDHVFRQMLFKEIPSENLPYAEIVSPEARNIVSILDIEGPPEKDGSEYAIEVDTLKNRPFGLIALGADVGEKTRNTASLPVKRWLAMLDINSLNMILTEPEAELLLVVNQSGEPDTDFIFVLSGRKIDVNQLLSSGFRIEKAEFGSVACTYDTPAREMEDSLERVGRLLFGTSGTVPLN